MLDAVFVNPNVGEVGDDVKAGVRLPSRKRQPLDLAYCAAVLEASGFTCRIIDALALGLRDDEILRLCEGRFVILNTSPIDRWECPYLSIEKTAALASRIKSERGACTILIGPHGTVTPEWVFEKADVDLLVMGEPEYTVLDIVRDLPREGMTGIAYRDGARVVVTPPRAPEEDLDRIPFPAYHLLPMETYQDMAVDQAKPFSLMVTTRGCTARCTFCLKRMWGSVCRARSTSNVIQEILLLQKTYGVKGIYFQDLTFCSNRDRVVDLCRGMLDAGMVLRWACSARLHDVDEELARLMKQAGCVQINFGLESASATVLRNARKGINTTRASETIRAVRKAGIRASVLLMLGLPGETEETIEETLRFAVANKIEFFGAGLCIPYPGTALWDGHWTWEDAGRLAGTVGTDILRKFPGKQLERHVMLRYIRMRYSALFLLNPLFYVEVLPRVFKRLVARRGEPS